MVAHIGIISTVGVPGAGLGTEKVIRARGIAGKAVPAHFGRRVVQSLPGVCRGRTAREEASTAEVGNPNGTVIR